MLARMLPELKTEHKRSPIKVAQGKKRKKGKKKKSRHRTEATWVMREENGVRAGAPLRNEPTTGRRGYDIKELA
jgi:hypothetical protein